jgi:hypothetical protein
MLLQAKADVVFKENDNSNLNLAVGSYHHCVTFGVLILNNHDWDIFTGHSRTCNLGAWRRIHAIMGFYQGTNHLFLSFVAINIFAIGLTE